MYRRSMDCDSCSGTEHRSGGRSLDALESEGSIAMMKSGLMVAGVVAVSLFLGIQSQAQPVAVTSTAYLLLEREAAELIEQVEEAGRDVQYHAKQAERLAGNPEVSRWTHYHHLEGISWAVNRSLRPSLKRLLDAQDQLPGRWKTPSYQRPSATFNEVYRRHRGHRRPRRVPREDG
jgi:hypothetical protein